MTTSQLQKILEAEAEAEPRPSVNHNEPLTLGQTWRGRQKKDSAAIPSPEASIINPVIVETPLLTKAPITEEYPEAEKFLIKKFGKDYFDALSPIERQRMLDSFGHFLENKPYKNTL